MRWCSARPQPAITLQWRSAYVIYDCVYLFALYGTFNVLFLLRCHTTLDLLVGTITFSSLPAKINNIVGPSLPFIRSIHDTTTFCEDKFGPFFDFFQVFAAFLKNWRRKCSWMHNSICTAYANSRILARRDDRFAAIIFQSKRVEQPAENMMEPLFCVMHQSEELCTLSPLFCSRRPNLWLFFFFPLSADKKN